MAVVACALAACSYTIAQTAQAPDSAADTSEEFSYTVYGELLKQYVDIEGRVDYAALRTDRAGLDRFVASMGNVAESELASWSEEARLAFWINAYNAITLQYIVDHYPIEKGGLISGLLHPANSIRQIPGVWDKLTTPVAGKPLTLDAIEHEILRKEFSEPRIHMAIVCASVGCPPLRNEPFAEERLDQQLDDQSRRFLGSPVRFRIDRTANEVYLSPIFKWFGEDFVPVYGASAARFSNHGAQMAAVLNFVSSYVSETDAAFLEDADLQVKFSDYDWSLNEQ